jgi:hypothetical protein
MRLPMMARYRFTMLSALAMTGMLLAGCAGDATAPAARTLASQLATSPFQPTAAQRALVDVSDGTYTFTVDPSTDETLALGASRLSLPSHSICDLSSSYGPTHWNESCTPERGPVTITAVVRDAATDHPSIDFQPAMRFNPDKNVMLYVAVSNQATLDATRVLQYCNATGCVNEALTDTDLESNVDTTHQVVFRRIKHFSGYLVSSFSAFAWHY